MTRVAVAIMAKAPIAGAVKTRLCPPLTPEQAASLARCFLLDTIERIRAVPGIHAVLAYAPAEARETVQALAPDLPLLPQRGEDLGSRMGHVLADLLAEGHAGALAIGSDTPSLPATVIQQAVRLLDAPGADIVLGPSDDGGYYLIGMRRVHRSLFEDMPWSTSRVLDETRRRAAAAGLAVVTLPPWFDVDTVQDLARLRLALERGDGDRAPRTAALLARWRSPAEAR